MVHSNEIRPMREAISEFQQDKLGDTFWDNFNPDLCSWDQVYDMIEAAERAYGKKGAKYPVRRAFRHGNAITRNLKPLLEAIPDSDGLGLVKGGLTILFAASVEPLNPVFIKASRGS